MEVADAHSSENGGGDLDFYEDIEAPKFVDFKSLDRYCPDDRYWFCLRVGCDQKHEEEMDSETIYKNFVLRVMAARSPNVRYRKRLTQKPNTTLKCPLSAPPKPSKPRVPRLAVLSSISGKLAPGKEKLRTMHKPNTTPTVKAKQSSVATKALTTPRNKKPVSKTELFRSVRKPKAVNGEAQNKKVVAKALTFQSPRKVPKVKTSLELKRICAGMKKLEITGQRKNILGYESSIPAAASKKKLGTREVKSRVYDSLRPQISKGKEIGSSRGLKKKSGVKDLKGECHDLVANDGQTGESSDMEVDDKSSRGSSEAFSLKEELFKSTPQVCSSDAATEPRKSLNLDETILLGSLKVGMVDKQVDLGFKGDETSDGSEEKQPASSAKVEKQEESIDQDKENHKEPSTDEDKENASAPENRQQNCDQLCKHDKPKKCQKFIQGSTKAPKEKATSDAKSTPCLKHVKSRPTNPKPFRLRTDERGILKEANSEKKLITPCKEGNGTDTGHLGGNLQKQHRSLIKSKKVSGQNKDSKANQESAVKIDKKPSDRSTTPRIRCTFLENEGQDSSETTRKIKSLLVKQQKSRVVPSQIQPHKTTKKIKSPLVKQMQQPRHVRSQLKAIMEVPTINLDLEEKAKSNKCVASPATKGTASGTSRSLSRSKRHPTIPKEPNFHTIHVPKSCIRKLA